MLNYMPEIYKRYKAPEANKPFIGNAWIDLNMPLVSYSHLDVQSHVLFAASIWILDQITERHDWREMYRLLPKDDRMLDELCRHDAWDSRYDYDLIYSVEYVLHHRNPLETDGAGYERMLTNEYLAHSSSTGARGAKDAKEAAEAKAAEVAADAAGAAEAVNRQNYDTLIAMIPQEAIDEAVEHFRVYFWQWVDRFFENLTPFTEAIIKCDEEIRADRIEYNKLVEEFGAAVDKLEKLRKQKPRTAPSIPLMNPPANPFMKSSPLEMLNSNPLKPRDPLSMLVVKGNSDIEQAADYALSLSSRLDQVGIHYDDLVDKVNELFKASRTYSGRMTRQGRIMNDGLTDFGEISVQPMEPILRYRLMRLRLIPGISQRN